MVNNYVNLAEYLASLIRENQDLILVCEPQFTNICIRFRGDNLPDKIADLITNNIRDELIRNSKFMITKTMIGGRPTLRPVVANPAVDQEALRHLVSEIVNTGNRLASQYNNAESNTPD